MDNEPSGPAAEHGKPIFPINSFSPETSSSILVSFFVQSVLFSFVGAIVDAPEDMRVNADPSLQLYSMNQNQIGAGSVDFASVPRLQLDQQASGGSNLGKST